jgi:signal transduction histidine kinase
MEQVMTHGPSQGDVSDLGTRAGGEDARRTAGVAEALAEEAQRRSTFLAEAGTLLSASLDYEETLVRLGELCVRSLADWCLIALVEGDQLRPVGGAHADPAKAPLVAELQRRHPPIYDAPYPSTVLRSGEPLLVSEVTPENLRAYCSHDDQARLLLEMGCGSALQVALRARGRPLGVLTLGAAERGRFQPREVQLASEVAHWAAIAIDNAQLYREAQRAVAARDEFLSIASHELRTPLQSLQLVLQSLERGGAGAPGVAPRLLSVAVREAERLAALVAQLLDVVRIERGRLELSPEDCDLVAEARHILDCMDVAIQRSGSTVTVHAPDVLRGRWDRSHLDQLLANLLSNALTYGKGGPVDVTIEPVAGAARRVRIAVRDRGIGITPERLPHVFERFERASSTRHYGGLGLGLFIARTIVRAHRGTITAESEPDRGSTFTVELPIDAAAEARPSEPLGPDEQAAGSPAARFGLSAPALPGHGGLRSRDMS